MEVKRGSDNPRFLYSTSRDRLVFGFVWVQMFEQNEGTGYVCSEGVKVMCSFGMHAVHSMNKASTRDWVKAELVYDDDSLHGLFSWYILLENHWK